MYTHRHPSICHHRHQNGCCVQIRKKRAFFLFFCTRGFTYVKSAFFCLFVFSCPAVFSWDTDGHEKFSNKKKTRKTRNFVFSFLGFYSEAGNWGRKPVVFRSAFALTRNYLFFVVNASAKQSRRCCDLVWSAGSIPTPSRSLRRPTHRGPLSRLLRWDRCSRKT